MSPTFYFEFYIILLIIVTIFDGGGHAVAQLVEALRYKPECRGFDSRGVIGIFHWQNPSGRTASNGNEYQEYLLGLKAAGA